jgi:hypothetical protein
MMIEKGVGVRAICTHAILRKRNTYDKMKTVNWQVVA